METAPGALGGRGSCRWLFGGSHRTRGTGGDGELGAVCEVDGGFAGFGGLGNKSSLSQLEGIFFVAVVCRWWRKNGFPIKIDKEMNLTDNRLAMPESVSISLSFIYTKSDYVGALRAHNASRLNLPLDLLMSVVSLGGGALFWQSPNLHWLAIGCIALPVVFALMLAVAFTVIPVLACRGETKVFGDTMVEFTREDIHLRTAQFDSRVQWSIYSRVLTTKHLYLLYSRQRQFTVIPKRAFQRVEQQQAFEALLAERIARIEKRG